MSWATLCGAPIVAAALTEIDGRVHTQTEILIYSDTPIILKTLYLQVKAHKNM